MPATLSQSEIDERARVLRRFRDALLRQRERFNQYLRVLEEQPIDDSGCADPARIETHVEIEEAIVREIAGFEQVIEPLELMYRERDPEGAADLPKLRAALNRTRDEVVRRTEYNRELLKQQIDSLRREISGLRMMQQPRRAAFSTTEPTTIDISA